MNTLNVSYRIKRISAISVGIILLSICGQSISSAYQYPVLTSHQKFRIFVQNTSSAKAPVAAALRILPPQSSTISASVLGTIDISPVLVSPATLPTDVGSNPYITYGDATPTYSPSYVLPAHVVLAPIPVCGVAASVGTLDAGRYTVDCLNGPTSATQDESGTAVNYAMVYHTLVLDVLPAAHQSISIANSGATAAAGGSGIVVSSTGYKGSSAITYALSPADPNCSLSGSTVNAIAEGTCYVVATIAAGNYVTASSTAAPFVFTAPVVDPVSWTLTANDAAYTIGGTPPTLSAIASPTGGLSGSATCAIYATGDDSYISALTLNSSLSVTTYKIHCTGTAAAGYNAATLVDGTLTVSAAYVAPVTVTVNHHVSYNLSGGTGTIPAAFWSPVGSGYTTATGNGLSKEGFTFGGWSDGTHAYPANTVEYVGSTDIVLSAVWVLITPPDSGAQPIVLPKSPVVVPVAPTFTSHSVASNLVANFIKIVDVTFGTKLVAIPHDAGTSLTLTDGVAASLQDQLTIVVTAEGVSITAVKGWTGRISFPVVATQNGVQVELFIGVEEDPASVLKPTFNLVSTKNAKVAWTANNSQVELYNVYLGNKLACTATKTTCTLPISSIKNFKSNMKIESVGHQQTYSQKIAPAYAAKILATAGIVHFGLGSSGLTATEKKYLDGLIKSLKTLGVTNVTLNGHADSTGAAALNKKLSADRVAAVKSYIAKALPKLKVTSKVFSSSAPIGTNSTVSGRSDNRRVEVLVG